MILVLDPEFAGTKEFWQPFEQFEAVEFVSKAVTADVERYLDAEIVVCNRKMEFDRDLLSKMPNLKYIGTVDTGYNNFDLEFASERGIVVTNTPGYSSDSVAQTAFSLLLEICQKVGDHDQDVHAGKWCEFEESLYAKYRNIELAGLTFGILGFGEIGRATCEIARGFKMNLLAHTRSDKSFEGCRFVDLETLFSESDVVSIHTPLTEETSGLVDAKLLGLMKKTSILINTSRGGVINEQDLADSLNAGKIAAAGLDVLTEEPPAPDCPLFTAKNCVICPHIAWTTFAARKRKVSIAAENVKSFLGGKMVNQVN